MLEFEKKTMEFIKKHSLINKGDYILVAVSGGPDSMAMLDFLVNRKEYYGIELAVAHVNHLLRREAKRDADYVKDYCAAKGIVFRSTEIDIKEKMDIDQTGMQETARKYRYLYFEKVFDELPANKLFVGQHGDDQVETMLMRLVRGSSGIARAGIRIKRSFSAREVIRPLLAVTKEEIEEYCLIKNLNPRRDASNEKKDYTRNRFRLEMLPFLKNENQRVHEHFQRFSEEIIEDEMFLKSLANEKIKEICQEFDEEEVSLDISLFLKVPLPLQRRMIHLILNYLYNQRNVDLSAFHIDLIRKLFEGHNPSQQLDLPLGLKVIRSYNRCRFTFKKPAEAEMYHFELFEGDEALLPNNQMIRVEKGQDLPEYNSDDRCIFDLRDIHFPIIIRTREPGDRIEVKGLNGTKKLKDIFIDMKVPLEERSNWPIVTDKTGKLLWIPGLKKSRYDTSLVHSNQVCITYCKN
ncbi:tRNA lysidine(34) synthetase TilS [Pseudogracilibacillus auburnensis]|uniref:tRNA lysidine(34) synthetase TilS n=1 Tax=Pseudogracilibacillus auburnensis TaxID=1494959 RepID=UPI001A96FE5B|nr:tRNA lysidine(34) synthetase TilS [Pseudogracilibacillus auburnensis]MBO1004707.1 tRNA lysidine(34) synthetase TilS [Pseudogracilibacillus auburnensis]